jgi:DNA polymerase phi
MITENFAEALFASTLERKFLGFQLFALILPKLHKETIPLVFTSNFMRSLINHLSSKDNYLHKAAKQTVTSRCFTINSISDS